MDAIDARAKVEAEWRNYIGTLPMPAGYEAMRDLLRVCFISGLAAGAFLQACVVEESGDNPGTVCTALVEACGDICTDARLGAQLASMPIPKGRPS